jgi:hypothetical protein
MALSQLIFLWEELVQVLAGINMQHAQAYNSISICMPLYADISVYLCIYVPIMRYEY